MKSSLQTLDVLGAGLKVNGEMVSLTDLWKSQGGNSHNAPAQWIRLPESVKLLRELRKSFKGGNIPHLETRRGRYTGGTYAHWQLALAYAKYLSPKLHLAVNDVFRRFQNADIELTENLISRTESVEDLQRIEYRARVRQTNKALGSVISVHGGEAKTFAMVHGLNNLAVTGKKTAEIKRTRGLTPSGHTRDVFTLEEMATMAFTEMLESRAIEKSRAIGHDRIYRTCANVAGTVSELAHQYA
jgi:hypothetical protein